MKRVRACLLIMTTAAVMLGLGIAVPGQDAAPSGCVKCHTDVKKLIRLGWEVERVRGKPATSAENEGEG